MSRSRRVNFANIYVSLNLNTPADVQNNFETLVAQLSKPVGIVGYRGVWVNTSVIQYGRRVDHSMLILVRNNKLIVVCINGDQFITNGIPDLWTHIRRWTLALKKRLSDDGIIDEDRFYIPDEATHYVVDQATRRVVDSSIYESGACGYYVEQAIRVLNRNALAVRVL